jgi:hypothetical protein
MGHILLAALWQFSSSSSIPHIQHLHLSSSKKKKNQTNSYIMKELTDPCPTAVNEMISYFGFAGFFASSIEVHTKLLRNPESMHVFDPELLKPEHAFFLVFDWSSKLQCAMPL